MEASSCCCLRFSSFIFSGGFHPFEGPRHYSPDSAPDSTNERQAQGSHVQHHRPALQEVHHLGRARCGLTIFASSRSWPRLGPVHAAGSAGRGLSR